MTSIRSLHGDRVFVLGPHLGAISGVSAHLHSLLRSRLQEQYVLEHFMVGNEGRGEKGPRRWLRLATSPLSLAAAIRSSRPAILHVNSSLNAGAFWRDLVYMLVARLHGVRVVCQIHGGKLPQAFLGRSGIAHALLRRLLGLPDALVVLAEAEQSAYREFLPHQRVLLIPNSIDCSALGGARSASDEEAPLRMIYLGRLAREKGLEELVAALADARRQGARATLTIVGSGPDETWLRNESARLGLDPIVTFAGAAFGEAKGRLLRTTDVFVLPSYSEGLPFALLEAMAAGNGVIATRVGAIPDVVIPGVHGTLVPPRDTAALATAIARMAADRPALARMQRACAARIASGYSLERLAARFGDLYGQLLGSSPSPHPQDEQAPRAGQASRRHVAECAE